MTCFYHYFFFNLTSRIVFPQTITLCHMIIYVYLFIRSMELYNMRVCTHYRISPEKTVRIMGVKMNRRISNDLLKYSSAHTTAGVNRPK